MSTTGAIHCNQIQMPIQLESQSQMMTEAQAHAIDVATPAPACPGPAGPSVNNMIPGNGGALLNHVNPNHGSLLVNENDTVTGNNALFSAAARAGQGQGSHGHAMLSTMSMTMNNLAPNGQGQGHEMGLHSDYCSVRQRHPHYPSNHNNVVVEGGQLKRIPRPRNAFMIFAGEHRKLFHQMHPDVANGEISVKLGDTWHNLPPDVKKLYFEKSKLEEREHKRRFPFYQYKPGPSMKRRRYQMSPVLGPTSDRMMQAPVSAVPGERRVLQVWAGQQQQNPTTIQECPTPITERSLAIAPVKQTSPVVSTKPENIRSMPVLSRGPGRLHLHVTGGPHNDVRDKLSPLPEMIRTAHSLPVGDIDQTMGSNHTNGAVLSAQGDGPQIQYTTNNVNNDGSTLPHTIPSINSFVSTSASTQTQKDFSAPPFHCNQSKGHPMRLQWQVTPGHVQQEAIHQQIQQQAFQQSQPLYQTQQGPYMQQSQQLSLVPQMQQIPEIRQTRKMMTQAQHHTQQQGMNMMHGTNIAARPPVVNGQQLKSAFRPIRQTDRTPFLQFQNPQVTGMYTHGAPLCAPRMPHMVTNHDSGYSVTSVPVMSTDQTAPNSLIYTPQASAPLSQPQATVYGCEGQPGTSSSSFTQLLLEEAPAPNLVNNYHPQLAQPADGTTCTEVITPQEQAEPPVVSMPPEKDVPESDIPSEDDIFEDQEETTDGKTAVSDPAVELSGIKKEDGQHVTLPEHNSERPATNIELDDNGYGQQVLNGPCALTVGDDLNSSKEETRAEASVPVTNPCATDQSHSTPPPSPHDDSPIVDKEGGKLHGEERLQTLAMVSATARHLNTETDKELCSSDELDASNGTSVCEPVGTAPNQLQSSQKSADDQSSVVADGCLTEAIGVLNGGDSDSPHHESNSYADKHDKQLQQHLSQQEPGYPPYNPVENGMSYTWPVGDSAPLPGVSTMTRLPVPVGGPTPSAPPVVYLPCHPSFAARLGWDPRHLPTPEQFYSVSYPNQSVGENASDDVRRPPPPDSLDGDSDHRSPSSESADSGSSLEVV